MSWHNFGFPTISHLEHNMYVERRCQKWFPAPPIAANGAAKRFLVEEQSHSEEEEDESVGCIVVP